MVKIVFKRIVTYIFYLVFSFLFGYLSTLGEYDYLAQISNTIIPILMTLMVLYASISGQLILRLIDKKLEKDDLNIVVNAMERNVIIEAIILISTFAFIACFSWLISLLKEKDSLLNIIYIIRNALVSFDVLYFVYVVYDSTIGLYHLIKS